MVLTNKLQPHASRYDFGGVHHASVCVGDAMFFLVPSLRFNFRVRADWFA